MIIIIESTPLPLVIIVVPLTVYERTVVGGGTPTTERTALRALRRLLLFVRAINVGRGTLRGPARLNNNLFLLVRERCRLGIPVSTTFSLVRLLCLLWSRITWLIGSRRYLGLHRGLSHRSRLLLRLFRLLGCPAFFLILLLLLLIITILRSRGLSSVTRTLRSLIVHLLLVVGCWLLFVLGLSGLPASMVPPIVVVGFVGGGVACMEIVVLVLGG